MRKIAGSQSIDSSDFLFLRGIVMEKIVIKAVREQEDLIKCLEIRRNVFTEEMGISPKIEVDEQDRLGSGCEHFLTFLKGNPVATCRCKTTAGGELKIQRFCVLKEYRNFGVGKEVLLWLESYYFQKGITKIVIDSKYKVFSFYQKCGYQIHSEEFIEAGVEHVRMEKILYQR